MTATIYPVTTQSDRGSIAIRHTRIADAALLPGVEHSSGEAFRAIESLAWLADGEDHSEASHLARVGTGTSWVVVDDADVPIGFLFGDIAGDAFHIVEISVRLDRQRSGAGTALLSHVIGWAHDRGLREITLTTFRDVAWNAPFYRRFGFHEIAWQELGQQAGDALRREAAIGLPRELRCAMRLDLKNGSGKR